MAAYIAILLSLTAIILFIIILVRFKKLFSTDAIIEKTRSHLNKMLGDINRQSNSDLELIEESTRRIKALLNESDKKMEQFREATQRLRDMISEAEKYNRQVNKEIYVPNEGASKIKAVGQSAAVKNLAANKYIKNSSSGIQKSQVDPDAVYSPSGMTQKSLFDEDETKVTPDGAAYKEVPLIITKVLDEEPVQENAAQNISQSVAANENSQPVFKAVSSAKQNAKNLSEQVQKLFNQGMQVEDIATELSCSISEVQFIVDMF